MALLFKQVRSQAASRGLRIERTDAPGFFRVFDMSGAELRRDRGRPWTLACIDRYLADLPLLFW